MPLFIILSKMEWSKDSFYRLGRILQHSKKTTKNEDTTEDVLVMESIRTLTNMRMISINNNKRR